MRIAAPAIAVHPAGLWVEQGITLPVGSRPLPPMHPGDQGVSPSEARHADRLIASLLAASGVAYVVTVRGGCYEIHGKRGVIRYQRFVMPNGELSFRIVEVRGENPIPSTDPYALRTLEAEIANAGGAQRPPDNRNTSYPDILRRVAQLFDHERAPDLAYIQIPGGDPNHPHGGSHGSPDVTQSRSPLIIAGPGVAHGATTMQLARLEDIAPTVAELVGVRPVLGRTGSGVVRPQLLRWQDGDSLAGAIADPRLADVRPYGLAQRAVVFVLDGASSTVLHDQVARGNLPNIARVMAMGTDFANGGLSEYPTVTWANHHTIVTGASPGHSGIVNNSWFDRARGTLKQITDGGFRNSLRNGRFVDPQVETLYEAVRRTFGPGAITASLNDPAGRGATVGTLELTGVGTLLRHVVGIGLRYLDGKRHAVDAAHAAQSTDYRKASGKDNLAASIGASLLTGRNPAKLQVFEFTLPDNQGHFHGPQSEQGIAALQEADRNVGRVLDTLERQGLLDSTAIVVTADHGMEHQEARNAGGWSEAIRRSGVVAVDDTRFVYIRNLKFALTADPLRVGSVARVSVLVSDDDVDEHGRSKPVAGALVAFTDVSGSRVTAVTGADGRATLSVVPAATGAATLEITHEQFTPERQVITVS